MKVTICDDNHEILIGLQQMLQKIYADEIQVDTTRLHENLLDEWQKHLGKVADILLMDIEYSYSNKNGITIAGELQTAYPNVKVVFITGNINYAQDIFEVVPSSFLVKPIDECRLQSTIDKIGKQMLEEQSQNVCFKTRGNVVKIPAETIRYIESSGHQVKVHTQGNDMVFRMKLTECMDVLPEKFWMVHQSFIVNSQYVKGMTKEGIELFGRIVIPVARSKYKEIKNRLFDELESD